MHFQIIVFLILFVFQADLVYNHANANSHFLGYLDCLFCCGYLEILGFGIAVGGYLRKEITTYEIIISNYSFNGHSDAIILKFQL